MGDVWAALGTAEFAHIVGLSLTVSFAATAVAAVVGLPCGAALAICRFPGRRVLILLANAFLGLPPVVVGLALYLVLSRSGPLGALALLFTPSAMILAQVLLATPIIALLNLLTETAISYHPATQRCAAFSRSSGRWHHDRGPGAGRPPDDQRSRIRAQLPQELPDARRYRPARASVEREVLS